MSGPFKSGDFRHDLAPHASASPCALSSITWQSTPGTWPRWPRGRFHQKNVENHDTIVILLMVIVMMMMVMMMMIIIINYYIKFWLYDYIMSFHHFWRHDIISYFHIIISYYHKLSIDIYRLWKTSLGSLAAWPKVLSSGKPSELSVHLGWWSKW